MGIKSFMGRRAKEVSKKEYNAPYFGGRLYV